MYSVTIKVQIFNRVSQICKYKNMGLMIDCVFRYKFG